jgi:hypothetical protein
VLGDEEQAQRLLDFDDMKGLAASRAAESPATGTITE